MNDLGILLAIDPSIRSVGAALFRNGDLIAAARLTIKPNLTKSMGERVQDARRAIIQWVVEMVANYPDTIAFEWPQIYAKDTPAVANAVVSMAAVGSAVAGKISHAVGVRVLTWVPRDIWGQLPKCKTGSALNSPRGQRIWSRLSEAERAVVVDQHDSLDAVGIGLHSLGRLGVKRAAFTSG